MCENVSIIIPVYKEKKKTIEKILKNLLNVKNKYEVIFVDSSNDTYLEEIVKYNKFTYIKSPKGRAVQMNRGFLESSGDLVFFLHSDSVIEEDCIDEIIFQVKKKNIKFGCLSLYFDDGRLLMKICSFMSRLRVIFRKIAFGDQGLFFERKYFEKLGMYKEIQLMEDYDISIRSKQIYPVVQISSKIITSSRKYYEGKGIFNKGSLSFIGILLNMLDMQKYQRQFRKGYSPQNIAKEYYKK
ncbi:TIGR04283 family arsenosugar biosynthesis glycosyltransferase [Peptostreptococcus faecalis]|uniref:TIGR04283 family arsenosugar biosynthesis glycosyltransferase n=1 Tax=Peptostreptococcus faecalis TaxID=2045015 RepID=UPI000C7BAEA5|nr:TIGR04283 family arsenosugar biosynthesis glycosyltransferase [Peptostreptococcus faecalis]